MNSTPSCNGPAIYYSQPIFLGNNNLQSVPIIDIQTANSHLGMPAYNTQIPIREQVPQIYTQHFFSQPNRAHPTPIQCTNKLYHHLQILILKPRLHNSDIDKR